MNELFSMDEEPRLTKRERRALRKQERLQQSDGAKKRKQVTTWISISVLLALVTTGIIWIVMRSNNNKNTNSVQTSSDTVTVNDSDWSSGPKDAKVTLLEYSDFQCPACGFYYPLLKRLQGEFAGRLRFVYRNYPLRTVHKNAQLAAQAAEAAGLQNKFWEMHDYLFERQNDWSGIGDPADAFTAYAKDLGLDMQKFAADLKSSAVQQSVDEDIASGDALRVDSTPTFFLQGKKVDNPPSNYDALKKLVDDALAQS